MTEPLRFWNLSRMAKSPMHYEHALTAEDDPTYAMERGSSVHAIVFGTQRVLAYPGKTRAGKEWEAFKAANADALILTRNEYEKSCSMAEAVWNHAEAMELLTGITEKTLHFEFMGRPARATPDCRAQDRVTELKTTMNTEPEKLMRHCQRMHYHAQLAWYRDAVLLSGEGQPRDAYIVAVESSAPHPVTVLRLTERTLDQGARAVRLWFERLRACEESNFWPPYVQSIVDWDIEEELELEFADDDEPAAGAA